MAACSIAVCGWETIPAFLETGTHFRATVLEQGGDRWG
ncbi:hypothetical protein [Cupriavidus necator]